MREYLRGILLGERRVDIGEEADDGIGGYVEAGGGLCDGE